MIDDSVADTQKLTIGNLMAQVSRLVGRRLREKLEGIGLQRAQGLILIHLWHHDGIPQNALAQALHITPATTTNTLKRMERDGWVERCRDEADQRIVRVRLTDKARTLHTEVRDSFHDLDIEMTSALTQEECEILHRSLLKVRRHLAKAHQHVFANRPNAEAAWKAGRKEVS